MRIQKEFLLENIFLDYTEEERHSYWSLVDRFGSGRIGPHVYFTKKYITGYWENGRRTSRDNLLGEKLWFVTFKGKKYNYLHFIPPFWFTVFTILTLIIASVNLAFSTVGAVIAFCFFIIVSFILIKSIIEDYVSFKNWLKSVTEYN